MQNQLSYFPGLAALAAVAAAALLYAPALRGPFVFDDYGGVIENPRVAQAAQHLRSAFEIAAERPLSVLLFGLGRRFFGTQPLGYHMVSLLLHLLNVLLAAYWLRAWAGSGSKSESVLRWAPLLFAVHPVGSESVAYIYSASTLLAAAFTLMALLALQRLGAGWRWLAASGAAALAILAKEEALIVPWVLIWAELCRGDRTGGAGRARAARIALLAASGGLALAWLTRWAAAGLLPSFRHWVLGLLTQARVFVANAGLLLWPVNQCADRDFAPAASARDPEGWLALLIVAALLVGAWRLRGRDRLAAFALGWIVLQALPYFAVPLAEIRVERRLYLASLGFAILLTLAVRRLPARLRMAGLAAVAALLAILLHQRVWIWTDEVRLWRDTVQKAPAKPRAWNNLGVALERRGQDQPARRAFERAVQLHPHHEQLHFNLGKLCRRLEDWDCARRELNAARELYAFRAATRIELGLLELDQSQPARAEAQFRAALRLAPGDGAAWQNLGLSQARQGRWRAALASFERARASRPDSADLRLNLGVALLALERPAAARRQLEQALRLQPDLIDARFLLGQAHQRLGDLEAARLAYLEVLEQSPDRDDVRNAFANLEIPE